MNGKQTLDFKDEEHATGISYCRVVLIREEEGKDNVLTQGGRYYDSYVKEDDQWLIADRKSYFM
ncbi:nuclear transport factor 2 family protein [Streptococcus troglodytae]|uniref:nuclear transport factor 2 family protein n=1 Tax=Streptococcus troglodytae TaxID=1111760 RepID=UPI001CB78F90|nr:nuclear transport factor 2 family protein [Streptococcus troglodytae]